MKNLISDNKGNALAFVMMVLLLVFFMVSLVISITQTNTRQASAQERGMQAYYAARSGVELAFAALWITDTGNELTGTTLLRDLKDGEEPVPETVDFGDAGTAEVAISYERSGREEKVSILSVGNYINSSRSLTLDVYFEVDEDTEESILKDMIWSK
ncbi:MAG TPA: pilus assembly PilX N-terminal domain-containing protein [Anaerovoracaceae bacterium]|nr:pilus assembly PilX N-terminal domain-containing protein [Anaerovoracaceae bacterium]